MTHSGFSGSGSSRPSARCSSSPIPGISSWRYLIWRRAWSARAPASSSPTRGIDISGVVGNLETTLADWSIGSLLGLWFQSIFVGLCSHILTIAIFLVIYGRMIEVYLTVSVGPIPLPRWPTGSGGQTGQNYLKSLLALGFQAFLIMVCVGIYAVLVQNIAVGMISPWQSGSAWAIRCCCATRCFAPAALQRACSGRIDGRRP